MRWKDIKQETPDEDRSLWLFGVDSNSGHGRYDIGRKDKFYGVMSGHDPSMDITHWAYCKEPTETISSGSSIGRYYNTFWDSFYSHKGGAKQ